MKTTSLNPEQAELVSNFNGARVVLAGPGSGKTKTMVEFFHELIAAGVPAPAIRGVTFSKEMAAVLEKRAGIKGVFSTFHSLGYEICSRLGDFKPVEPELRHRLLFRLTKKYKLNYKVLESFISRMRHANLTPQEATESMSYEWRLTEAYTEYEHNREKEGWIDFDDMLCTAVKLMEDPAKRAQYQFKYLIVDEAQDTDNVQWRLMQLLSEQHGNITVVGDPNQAIYTWRGASPENLTKFQNWFPQGKHYYLGRNYRSTQTVVGFVKRHAPRGCPQELLDKMIAARQQVGVPIGLKMYWKEDDEAESAVKISQKDPINTIIIARTNQLLSGLESVCNRHGIRYHLLGKSGFWKRNEVRKAIEALKEYAHLPIQTAMALAMPALESKYQVDDRTERDNDALGNLRTLRMIATRDYQNTKEFLVHSNKMIHRRNDPRGVTLSTVHQAKGGEWETVLLIGAKNGMMPHKDGDMLEEERIFFVAISRAIDRLRISWAGTPSPFLDRDLTEEIRDKLMEKANEVDRLELQTGLFDTE